MERKNLLVATVICFLMATLISLSVFAQTPAPPPDPGVDMGGFLNFLVSAFQGGQWFAVGSTTLMLVIFLVGRFSKINPAWLPVLSAAGGMLASLSVEFLKPEMIWYNALYIGLLTSGPASLFWSLLGKRILPQKKVTTA